VGGRSAWNDPRTSYEQSSKSISAITLDL